MYVHMSSIFSVDTEVYFRGIKFIVLTFKYWLEFSVYIWCFDRLIDWLIEKKNRYLSNVKSATSLSLKWCRLFIDKQIMSY